LDAEVMMTPSNNIRWKKLIKKGKRKELKYSATLEYPSDRAVDLGTCVTTSALQLPINPLDRMESLDQVTEAPIRWAVSKSFNPKFYEADEALMDYAFL
jgi:hypothetical protein